MRSEFLAGFVKRATEAGYSEEGVALLWKVAAASPEGKEIVEAFPVSDNPLSMERLVALSSIKQAMDNKEEVARLKEQLKTLCE